MADSWLEGVRFYGESHHQAYYTCSLKVSHYGGGCNKLQALLNLQADLLRCTHCRKLVDGA